MGDVLMDRRPPYIEGVSRPEDRAHPDYPAGCAAVEYYSDDGRSFSGYGNTVQLAVQDLCDVIIKCCSQETSNGD